MKNKRYKMTYDQLCQIDCRITICKYNKESGKCTNISPAITLIDDNFTCWTQKPKTIKIDYAIFTLEDRIQEIKLMIYFINNDLSGTPERIKELSDRYSQYKNELEAALKILKPKQ